MRAKVWNWLGGGQRLEEKVSPHTPALEQLEPRILLNADLIGLDPLTNLTAPQNDQAIYVDLDVQEQASSQDGSPERKVDLDESSLGGASEAQGVDGQIGGLDLDRFSEVLLSGALNLGEETAPVGMDSQAESASPETPFKTVEEGANIEIQASPCDAAAALLQDEAAQSGLTGGQDVVLCPELPSVEIRGPPADSSEILNPSLETTYTENGQAHAMAEGESASASNGTKVPDLSGMYLVDPDLSNWQGQIIYFDFDGEHNVTYNGPITIGPFDIPAFQAPTELVGREAEIMGAVTAGLNDQFAGTGVRFTLDQPQEPGSYSTVYVGGDGSWASEHGSFFGLAEQVDIGNQDWADNAFVFAERLGSPSGCVMVYAGTLADLIAHEVGHLLGYEHIDCSGGSLLASVADSGGVVYNREDAVAYAKEWDGEARNPDYHDYSDQGGDCANFVSQCLIAGGIDLSAGAVDDRGAIPSCTNLNNFLINELGATYELRVRREGIGDGTIAAGEPAWVAAGDIVILSVSPTRYLHAMFVVDGSTDQADDARYSGHTPDQEEVPFSDLPTIHPDGPLDYLHYYHISGQDESLKPTVDAFDVSPRTIAVGDTVTISYTVSDTGGSGLARVELWRATDENGNGQPDWPEDPDGYIDMKPLSGQQSSGYFEDTPSSPGTYWYEIHVVDNAGLWSAEPDPPGPIAIAVIDPYVITDVYELQAMNNDLSGWYVLGNDIDASETRTWHDGAGFIPIGDNSDWPASWFRGHFDGRGYTISGLYINRPETDYVGLFGVAYNAEIKDVGLTGINVTGRDYVGGLIGRASYAASFPIRCYTTGAVMGNQYVGGLIGLNTGNDITDCYSAAAVHGNDYIGGLVGGNSGISEVNWSAVTHCYSTGTVEGVGTNVGGLAGGGSRTGWNSCYWDTETSGQATSAGGMGKTTAEMRQQTTFVEWDFVNTWWMPAGDYPRLIAPEPAPPPADEVGRIVLKEPLELTDGPYLVGDTLTAKFTVENTGDAAITLDKLLLGGRFNGGELPGGGYPDFSYDTITIEPGQTHPYEGTYTLAEPGEYEFFIAYYIENPTEAEKAFLDENNWNTSIELGTGVTEAHRTRTITATCDRPALVRSAIDRERDRDADVVVTVDGAQYIIATLRNKIDPETLETVPDSGITSIYLDDLGNPVSSGEIAQKIGLIETARTMDVDFELRRDLLEAVRLSAAFMSGMEGAHGALGLILTGAKELSALQEVYSFLAADHFWYAVLTDLDKIRIAANMQPPTKLVMKAAIWFLEKAFGDPIEEARVDLDNAIDSAILHYASAAMVDNEHIVDDDSAYAFLSHVYSGRSQEDVAQYLVENMVLNLELLIYEFEPLTSLWGPLGFLEFAKLARKAALALEWELDTGITRVVGAHEATADLRYGLSDAAEYALELASAHQEVTNCHVKYYDEIQDGWEVAKAMADAVVDYLSANLDELLKNMQAAILHSPGELRVVDSEGRITGQVNGEVREGIANSMYDIEDEAIWVFDALDSYQYEIAGTDEGSYGLEVIVVDGDELTGFKATNIPTSSGAIHQYTIDWEALSLGEEGVTVMVDVDGDGVVDYTLMAGSELAGDAFVSPTSLMITVENTTKLYGEPNPVFTATYDGFLLGEDESVLAGELVFSTSADESSGVGTYTVSASGLSSENYEITYVDGTLEVTPAPLTVTVVDATKVYGQPNPAFSVIYDGFVPGEDESVLGGTLVFTTSADEFSPVGTYAISAAGLTSANYNITFETGTLTIEKADATIAVEGVTVTYDGNAHGASGTATGVAGEALDGLDLGDCFTDVPGGTANWVFTDVTGNYHDASGSVEIVIHKADQFLHWDEPEPILQGTALSETQLNATVLVVGPAPAGELTYDPPTGTVLEAGFHMLTITAAETQNYLSAAATVQIIVSGVSLVDSTLWIVGTPDDDWVHINGHGRNQIQVHTSFYATGTHRSFSVASMDRIIAHLLDGDDHMTIAGNVAIPALIRGGSGNNFIHTAGGPAILIGGTGNDVLKGGAGRNILIGGGGSNTLHAGRSGDVLIGGSTNLDDDDDALSDLLDQWNADDALEDRIDRVMALLIVEFDDEEHNTFYGGAGHDLIFAHRDDLLQGNRKRFTVA